MLRYRSIPFCKLLHHSRAEKSWAWTVGCIVVVAMLVGGCASSGAVRRSADEWFELGQRELARGKYTRAEEAFSRFLEQHPQDRRRPEALISLADAMYGDE